MPLNADGIGTRLGTGSDGNTYIIEHFLGKDGVIDYRTSDGIKLIWRIKQDVYEVRNSLDMIIKPETPVASSR